MGMNLRGINVILFYGEQAVSHFAEFVNQWTGILTADQWDSLRFVLAQKGEQPPMTGISDDVLNNYLNDNRAIFYNTSSLLSAQNFNDWLRSPEGNVKIHILYSPSQADADGKWLIQLLDDLSHIDYLSVSKLFYFLLSKDCPPTARETLSTLSQGENVCFLLGTVHAGGGNVPEEDRWQAATLAVLLSAAEELNLGGNVFSLGYSALNAHGNELTRLSEGAACNLLLKQLDPAGNAIAESDARELLYPNGLTAEDGIHDWLLSHVKEIVKAPENEEYRNAWVTIRMWEPESKQVLDTKTALLRMKEFIDLNYGGEHTLHTASEFAYQVQKTVKEKLRRSVLPACFPISALDSLIRALDRIAKEERRPASVSYDRPPIFKTLAKMEEYCETCKAAVKRSVEEYRREKCVSLFASALVKNYREIREWLSAILGTDEEQTVSLSPEHLLKGKIRELENSTHGSISQLKNKYRVFAGELGKDNPALSVLMNGMSDVYYFDENGNAERASWEKLIQKAGQNLAKRVHGYSKGRFFNYLHTEFSDDTARRNFFSEYLKAGPRMYYSMGLTSEAPSTFLLAEEELAEGWSIENSELFSANTDNAENLALYVMKGMSVADILQSDTIHFRGSLAANGGTSLGANRENRPASSSGRPIGKRLRSDSFHEADVIEEEAPSSVITLMPDENDEYQLRWKWNGNDNIATVIIKQYGEQVGKAASISIQSYNKNDSALNVTKDIMGGRPVPSGTLTVFINDKENTPYLQQDVPGRRSLIRYKISGCVLKLAMHEGQYLKNIALRTTNLDGNFTYYPLYLSTGSVPNEFYDMKLSDARIVLRPDADSTLPVSIVEVE